MHPEVAKLLGLQAIDGRIDILRRELASRPRGIHAQDTQLVAAGKERERDEAAIKAKKMEIHAMELELKTAEARISETRSKIDVVRTNQEFTALNTQIARLGEEKGRHEERMLVLWDELEKLEKRLAERARELERSRRVREEEGQAVERELVDVRKELEECERRRKDAVPPVDPDALAAYERLFARYGARSVVSAENNICAGCHMTVSPQLQNLLRSDSLIVHCTYCGRILHA